MAVIFDEPSHTYTNPSSGVKYISATTLIKSYTPPFDANYWSTYKAMKKVLEEKGEWVAYKKKAGGWDNVVLYVRSIDVSFPYRAEVLAVKKEILADWDDRRESAASAGTLLHKLKEGATKSKVHITESLVEIPHMERDLIGAPEFTENGVYTELLLYHDKCQIAGQADWVMKMGKKVSIKDYKTSKVIEKVAFQDECLLGPLSHLPNANFYTYSIQLSLYGWMLEQAGFEVDKLSIEHVDRHTHKTIEQYPVNYYRDEVVELVKDYVRKKAT
jgi:hypothetical protein